MSADVDRYIRCVDFSYGLGVRLLFARSPVEIRISDRQTDRQTVRQITLCFRFMMKYVSVESFH